MGMYDRVVYWCPNCGNGIEAQSKGGPCDFNLYSPNAVPADVADGLRIYGPCACGKRYRVKPIAMPTVETEIEEIEEET